ncbi:hypothetical protein CCACVL1_30930, partial [Corchorus capsularis]
MAHATSLIVHFGLTFLKLEEMSYEAYENSIDWE